MTDDGWFRTGDVVTIDARGYVEICDRSKDLIRSGGEWISSVALENALMGHPAVAEAAVVAIAHPKWGERPLAVVVLKAGRQVSAEDLRRHLAAGFCEMVAARRLRVRRPDPPYIDREVPEISLARALSRRACGNTRRTLADSETQPEVETQD